MTGRIGVSPSTNKRYIPFNRPQIGEDEIAEVIATLKSGWLTTGPRTSQFEEDFSKYVCAPFAQAVSSCTAGLHLALTALGIGPGDEVITTPLTFCSTVNTIMWTGATPVLADVKQDGNIDPEMVAQRITRKTRAIIPVHLAGLPCDMEPIWRLAGRNNLFVIEDAAHAVGAHYAGAPIGAGMPAKGLRSDVVAYSFYATKNLTTGEGGMVTTHRQDLYERMRLLCLHGISNDAWNRYTDRGKWYYEVMESGFKYNLSDIQSAIGIHQLRKLDHFIAVRKRCAEIFNSELAGMPEIEVPPDCVNGRHAWHLYTLRLRLKELSIDRGAFIQQLQHRGIGASVHFIPIPLHPFFKAYTNDPRNQCPKALALYETLISLPLYPSLSLDEIQYIAACVQEIAKSSKRALLSTGICNAVNPSRG
jgi:dTDP-4-amino-4,6-dideoxygalactose transaminase